jgi:peptidoglycan-associated lipoprotein
MKATRFTTLIAIGFALTFIAAGCKSPQNVTNIPGRRIPPQDINNGMPAINLPPAMPDTNSSFVGYPTGPGHPGWTDNADQFKDQTVHFAFDSSTIRTEENSKIATVADYLKGNPQSAVRAEGNCDERGTEEYNRSLGERRALAAREELIRLGITPDRVDTISYGEDKPVDPAHNEAAWKQNRRADFILLTPPAK